MEQRAKTLQSERRVLSSKQTLEVRARALGFVHPGELSYVVSKLPPN
jgi:cell division protein FtsB